MLPSADNANYLDPTHADVRLSLKLVIVTLLVCRVRPLDLRDLELPIHDVDGSPCVESGAGQNDAPELVL
ncbi:hypothetical protein Nepgr_032137 [Nepenthes gracilis]|uniref:Uncharacterized protein n=1 Tax=Nepenthes gracilis TaxID=150966 RepID=A0AAD3TJE7_NEPGR|nr:hypothetical protein Nepgr_032137 [Nepenthes gracilis]